MPQPTFPPRVPLREYFSSHRAVIRHMVEAYTGYVQRFGEVFQVKLINRDIIVSTKAEHAQHVLINHQKNYRKDHPTRVVGGIIGNGILTSEGDYWRQQRRLIQPAFHKQQLRSLSAIMVAETEDFLERLAQRSGDAIELNREMVALTLNVVSRSLFSTGIDAEGLQTVERGLNALMDLAMARIRNPLQVLQYRLNGQMAYFEQCHQELNALIYRIIDQRKVDGVGQHDLLDMLLSSKDADTGAELSRKQLLDELMVLFLAGHETSANGMTWTLKLLEQHPEVQQRMREEVERVVGDGPITFEHLPQLTYVKQVIDEGMRLYPPVWGTGRDAIEADEFDGISVAAGQPVMIFIHAIHRNPRYWEQPDRFDPDRFSPERSKDRPKLAYLPFGAGPRMCIGHQFAIFEMQIALALLLRHFDFQRTDDLPVPSEPAITLRPAAPLKMKFTPRVPRAQVAESSSVS